MNTLFLLAALTCLQPQDCPTPQVCAVDENGRGYCAQPNQVADMQDMTGRAGQSCNFQFDCDEASGLICFRTRALGTGVCKKQQQPQEHD